MLGGIAALGAAFAPGSAEAQKPRDFYEVQLKEPGILEIMEDLHLRLGEGSLRSRKPDGAFREANFVLKLFPNHPKALMMLVEACGQWRWPLRCMVDEAFQNAIVINPKASATYTIQGIYLHRKGRYPEAIQSFKQTLELNPSSVSAQYNLGLAYVETRQFELANEHAQRAYALGAPFPGLRSKLQETGHWKPLAVPESEKSSAQEPTEAQNEAAKK